MSTMTSTLEDWSRKIDARRDQAAADRNLRDRIFVADRFWEPVTEIFGEYDSRFGQTVNDTAEGSFSIPGDHPIVEWAVNQQHLDNDIHFYMETADFDPHAGIGKRIGYKVFDIDVEFDADGGFEMATFHGLEDFEPVKHIIAFANTLTPPELQFPKSDTQAGRACGKVRSYFFRNLARIHQPGWLFGFDLWSASNWSANMDPDRWPVVMAPQIRPDNSEWTVLSARFDYGWDLVKETLEDAGLQITTQRWLPGDPQPFPAHMTLTKPTLVLDVVERSFLSGATGTILDPILDLVRIIDPDGASETVHIADPNSGVEPPAGVNRPLAIWRHSQHQGLIEGKMTISKPTGHTVLTGGKSPNWVNSGIKLIVNSALGWIGTLIGLPGLGLGIFDSLVEDVVLAFQRFTNWSRKDRMGPHAYAEDFNPGSAWTLSALQSGRVGLHRQAGGVAFTAKVLDGQPYRLGTDIDLGERGGFEIGGRIWLGHIAHVERISSRTSPPGWELSIGSQRPAELPGTKALRHIDTLRQEVTRYTTLI